MDFRSYEEDSLVRPILIFIMQAVAVIAAAWLVVYFFGHFTVENGQSMQPTVYNGQSVLVDRFTYKFKAPERYDVIAYSEHADLDIDEGNVSLKRIVGLPGETVQIREGVIYIDGAALTEEGGWSVPDLAGIAAEPILLDETEYFVLGDNRQASEDSRFATIGNIDASRIITPRRLLVPLSTILRASP